MKLYKKAERKTTTRIMIKALKAVGYTTRNIGTWCKWKDLTDGGRYQAKLTIYEVENEDGKAYLVSDALEHVAAPINPNKKEVLDFLKEHGYKTEKKWYLEDYGMSEETWNEWNGIEES